MSQPQHAKRGYAPRAVPPHAVPGPLPAPDPEEPTALSTAGRPVCQLTAFELSLGVPGDPDFPLDGDEDLLEDFHEWRPWDEAIQRDMEME